MQLYLKIKRWLLSSMLGGLLLALFATGYTPALEQAQDLKEATAATKADNAAVLQSLPFSDRQSLEDANRGVIAPLPNNGTIQNTVGRKIWDLKDWDFEYEFGDIEFGIEFNDSVQQSYDLIFPEKNLIREDFENGRGVYRIQTKTSYGINRVDNPKGSGAVLRTELRYGDPVQSSGARAEIAYDKWPDSYGNPKDNPDHFIVNKMGVVYTYKFRTFKARNSSSIGSIVAQWHKREGTPPFALAEKDNGTYEIRMDDYSRNKRVRRPLGISVKKGEWTDWTFQIKWSKNRDGMFKVWNDGKQVFEYNGANTTQSQSFPAYFKLGIYKPGWSDDFKRGVRSDGRKIVRYYDDISIVEGISHPTRTTKISPFQIQVTPHQPADKPFQL